MNDRTVSHDGPYPKVVHKTPAKTWDIRFMRMAREVATWSKDPDEKVGAYLVAPDKRMTQHGYNGFPPGIDDKPERLKDKRLKNELMIHAEQNAIDNADRSVRGWVMYVTKPPCMECAKRIISRGVAHVVHPPISEESRWAQDQIAAQGLLAEANVRVTHYVE